MIRVLKSYNLKISNSYRLMLVTSSLSNNRLNIESVRYGRHQKFRKLLFYPRPNDLQMNSTKNLQLAVQTTFSKFGRAGIERRDQPVPTRTAKKFADDFFMPNRLTIPTPQKKKSDRSRFLSE